MPNDLVQLHLSTGELERLDALAQATERDRNAIITDAIAAYLEAEDEWVRRVEEGLRQADGGDFATDEEVAIVFRRSK